MKKFSFPKRNREFVFEPKVPYNLVADPAFAGEACLTFPNWCRILKIVRTHFAAASGGKKEPPPRAAPPRR